MLTGHTFLATMVSKRIFFISTSFVVFQDFQFHRKRRSQSQVQATKPKRQHFLQMLSLPAWCLHSKSHPGNTTNDQNLQPICWYFFRANSAGIRITGNPSYVTPLCSNPTRPYYGNPLVAARSMHPMENTPSTSGLQFISPANLVLTQQHSQNTGDSVQSSSPKEQQKPLNLSNLDSSIRPSPIYSITSLIPSTSQQLAMDLLQKHVRFTAH